MFPLDTLIQAPVEPVLKLSDTTHEGACRPRRKHLGPDHITEALK